jgi:hypothetical protein
MNKLPQFGKFMDAARRGRPSAEVGEPPYGFVVRVAAHSTAARPDQLAAWEKLSRWGAITASALTLIVVLFGRPHVAPNPVAELANDADAEEVGW